jgi:KDO2-lipid IV(A) lauroyltransferase
MFLKNLRIPGLSLSLSKFLQMPLNSIIFRFFPFPVTRCYLIILGSIYYLINWKEKSLVRESIECVFRGKLPASILKEKIKKAFIGIFDHYHEKLFVGYSNFFKLLSFLKAQVKFAGEEQLQRALNQGKGVILVTGHFGAVEMLPGALAINDYPTSMICRFQTTRLRKTLGKRAESVGLHLIDADEGNIIMTAMRDLKQGRILITEVDEFDEWRPDPHRDSHFLNCRLPSDRTLELLQKRSGAQVVVGLIKRDDKKRFTCHLTTVGNGTFPASMPLSDRCLSVLENMVADYPDQWYQWKKFGKLIKSQLAIDSEAKKACHPEPGIGLSLINQAYVG